MFLKPLMVPVATWLDDALGNGKRNPVKKWWFDHEVVDGVVRRAGATNRRDIDPARKLDPRKQKIAYYHADAMPAPDAPAPVGLDRKAALAAAALVETPDQARKRRADGAADSGPLHRHPGARDRGRRTRRASPAPM